MGLPSDETMLGDVLNLPTQPPARAAIPATTQAQQSETTSLTGRAVQFVCRAAAFSGFVVQERKVRE